MSGGDEYCIDSFYADRDKAKLVGDTLQSKIDTVRRTSSRNYTASMQLEGITCENEYAPLSPQDWNLKVGKDVNPEDDLKTQFNHLYNEFGRLVEEAQEGYDGALEGCSREILDAYCDFKFVFKNLENRLRKYGYDVDGAFEEVCVNNSLKYTTDFKLASDWKRWWYEQDPTLATMINVTTVDGIRYYCIKRVSDDKVLKPPHFTAPELTKYLPKEVV